MSTLLYLHGFNSSPESHKACQLQRWITTYRPDIHLLIPQLPYYPHQVITLLDQIFAAQYQQKIGIIGASLGGFYATWFSQYYSVPAVVINPLVKPADYLKPHLGREYRMRCGEVIQLNHQHLVDFATYQLPSLTSPDLLWLLAQQGDQILPYQLATGYYAACRQTIEQRGCHSFIGFVKHLPAIIKFLSL
jgi:uncharacterized protein